jgi:hypothetical protein
MTNVLDKVMDYEPTSNVPDMNDHVFDNDSNNDNVVDDERDVAHIEGLIQAVKPCLLDLLQTGWKVLENVNEKKVCKHATERLQ